MRKHTAAATLLVSLLGTSFAQAGELASFERGDLDERVFEPQVAPQVLGLDDAVEVEVVAPVIDRRQIDRSYRGFVEPSVSVSWSPLSFLSIAPTIEPGNERSIPVIFSYRLGPLSLESELAYHFVQGDLDAWTLDSALALDVWAGLSFYGAAKTTSSPDWSEIDTLFHAGASYAPSEQMTFLLAVGQGVRDHAFDSEERLALFAWRVLY